MTIFKSERIHRDLTARTRRKKVKNIVKTKTTNLFRKLKKSRKNA